MASKSEISYIQTSLLTNPPLRGDGRGLQDYRTIALDTGVVPLANGSARVSLSSNVGSSLPGSSEVATRVLAAVKLEVQDVDVRDGVDDGGRLVCTVSCSSSAYPNLNYNGIDEVQNDLCSVLQQTISHPSLRPANLNVIPGKKAWVIYLDVLVLSDNGNIYDALFLASVAALRDTHVPRTNPISYNSGKKGGPASYQKEDVDMGDISQSGFDMRMVQRATDFDLPDYWDEGVPLGDPNNWPVCITLNLVHPVHFLDATSEEENATPSRLLLLYSFPTSATTDSRPTPLILGIRLLGSGEIKVESLKTLISQGEAYALELKKALDVKFSQDTQRNVIARKK